MVPIALTLSSRLLSSIKRYAPVSSERLAVTVLLIFLWIIPMSDLTAGQAVEQVRGQAADKVTMPAADKATGQIEPLRLTILHTNDEHSHLLPQPMALLRNSSGDDNYGQETGGPTALGGYARIAGMVDQIRREKEAEGDPVLLFSGGDFLGGAPFAWLLLQGLAPELHLKQLIGYDAVVIGNHEFDYGTDRLADYLRRAGYPENNEGTAILGSNIVPPDNHPLARSGIQQTVFRDLDNGMRVGIFGLIGDDAVSKTAFPEPMEFSDPIETARRMVDILADQGADLIISVNHSGVEEDRLLAHEVPGIDLIVGGHSHTPLYEPIVEAGTVIVQAGNYLEYLGRLELSWHPDTGELSILNEEKGTPYLMRMDHSVPVDSDVEEMVRFYEETLNQRVRELTGGTIADLRQPVARSEGALTRKRMQEHGLGSLIADAIRLTTSEVVGERVDIAVQANGAIRSDLLPGLESEIPFYDLVMTSGLGFGEGENPGFPVVSFWLTGEEIRRVMEISHLLSELRGDTYFLQFSGVRKEYDPRRAILMNIPFTGTPIPTLRTVTRAERFTGDGIQENGEGWQTLERDDGELYRVATDYYIASFLPLVGELLPDLMIELKDEDGHAVELDDTVVYRNGEQLKVWQALVEFVTGLPKSDAASDTAGNPHIGLSDHSDAGASGQANADTGEHSEIVAADQPEPGAEILPLIDSAYHEAGERQVEVRAVPLWLGPAAILALLLSLVFYGLVRLRNRRKHSDSLGQATH